MKRIAAVLALLIASPALAASHVEWEGALDPDGYQHPPFTFDLTADGDGLALTITNSLTPTFSTPGAATLHLDGLTVGVVVNHGIGNNPDRVTVMPPPGYAAVPSTASLEEGETITVRNWVSTNCGRAAIPGPRGFTPEDVIWARLNRQTDPDAAMICAMVERPDGVARGVA